MKTALLALTFGAAMIAPGAQAQQANCAQREQIVERLSTKYGETRQSIGLGANNGVVETYASDETGTWTIIVTMPSGLACLVASGQAFETLAEAKALPGKDA